MKLSEIKKSVTVALMVSIATEDEEKSQKLLQDVEKQCQIVGLHLGRKLMMELMGDAEACLSDPKKYYPMMKAFRAVGARFSEVIEDD
tara:strand:- start:344 stop:607 length:264 start_codon:yes stop_codon:yes gene_type:complete